MITKNNLLQRLVGVFRNDDKDIDLPPEVSDKANYSYSNFRGSEPYSNGPRCEHKERNESELDVYTSGSQPRIELCIQ